MHNTDPYLTLASVKVTRWSCLVDELRPESVLGRTWNSSRTFEPRIEEEELRHYTERNGDLYGCAFDYERFCSSSSTVTRE